MCAIGKIESGEDWKRDKEWERGEKWESGERRGVNVGEVGAEEKKEVNVKKMREEGRSKENV